MGEVIIHRVNKIKELTSLPTRFGVEVDLRGYGNKILMSHDPIEEYKIDTYTNFEEYLKKWRSKGNNGIIVLNIKEVGYEDKIINLMKKYNIKRYFFQDAEFPYIYRATRELGIRNVSVRFSEVEPIEYVRAQLDENEYPLLDWVWIDTNTKLPITKKDVPTLKKFKTCLVCPERWGRPEDIEKYIKQLKRLNFKLDAVMTSIDYAGVWERSGAIKD